MMRVFGAVSHARGYVFSECGRQTIYLLFMGLALWIFFPYGLEGIALAAAIAIVIRYLLLAHLSLKLTGVKWREFFVSQVPGITVGMVALPVYTSGAMGRAVTSSDVLVLVLVMAVSVASLILIFLLFPSSWFGDLYPWLVERFGSSLPHRLPACVTAKLLPAGHGAVARNKMKAGV